MFKFLFIISFFGALRLSEAVSPDKSSDYGLSFTPVGLYECCGATGLCVRSIIHSQLWLIFVKESICPNVENVDHKNWIITKDYGTHSFRIAADTHLAVFGVNESSIMKTGRWKSCRYKNYIRSALIDNV